MQLSRDVKKKYWSWRAVVKRKMVQRSHRLIRIGQRQYHIFSLYQNQLSLDSRHEEWMNLSYKSALICKRGAFVDVGVNTGQTMMKILSIFPDREYVGFEPQAECCHYVSEFIRQNRLDTHQILSIGLSDRQQVVPLLKHSNESDLTASIIEGFRPANFYNFRVLIYVTKGDDIIGQMGLQKISTIKIDVEGGEPEVIDGLQDTLHTHKPFVFFEVLNHFLVVTSQGLNQETILFREKRTRKMEKMLRDLGYRILNILPDGGVTEVPIIRPTVSESLVHTNYIAAHTDHFDEFIESCRLSS